MKIKYDESYIVIVYEERIGSKYRDNSYILTKLWNLKWQIKDYTIIVFSLICHLLF